MTSHHRFASLAMLLLLGPACDLDEDVGDEAQTLTSSTVPITEETISINSGRYRETMDVGGCTGTVIGPYAVLTASHCESAGDTGSVSWPASSVTFDHTDAFINPYATSMWWPTWWRRLNQEQVDAGIRLNDWAAGHDQAILFVPELTEAYIASRLRSNDWHPALLDATAPADTFVDVGNSPGGGEREFAPVEFDPATAGDISTFNQGAGCSSNRDGMFSIDGEIAANPGDSGGPVLGSVTYDWNGGTIEGARHVVSVNHNTCPDVAPAAYDVDVTLTTNQAFTVRLNDLWLRAVASDADGDLLPYECDSDPASPTGSSNLCPPPLGGPGDARIPRALLTCKAGYAATGIKGKQGWVIDQLAVECTAIACLERPTLSCSDVYWTDHFAGESSASSSSTFSRECPTGKVMDGLRGRQTAGTQVRELTAICHSFAPIRAGGVLYDRTELASVGNYGNPATLGTLYAERTCATGSVLIGFEARSNAVNGDETLQFITGLQPVCRDVMAFHAYHGGTGGEPAELSCPEGFVSIGATANTTPAGNLVGMLGLLCAEKSRVTAGTTISSSLIVIAHTSYATDGANVYPALVEKYTTYLARQPAGMVERRCSAGHAMNQITYRTGSLVDQITSIACKKPNTSLTESHALNVGGTGGSAKTVACSADYVDGILAQNGSSLDGLALRCRPY